MRNRISADFDVTFASTHSYTSSKAAWIRKTKGKNVTREQVNLRQPWYTQTLGGDVAFYE